MSSNPARAEHHHPHPYSFVEAMTPPEYATSSSGGSSIASPPARHANLPTVLDLFHLDEGAARPSSSDEHEHEHERDSFGSSNSDSYDSSGEGGPRHRAHLYSGDEGWESRVSSRANSPSLPEWDGPRSELLSLRSGSRNRSRNQSGTTTPVMGYSFEKDQYGADDYHSHHYQTSALLRKLGGTLAPENSPVVGYKKRRPGWWARRAETRRRNSLSSSSSHPLPPPVSKSGRNRSCLSMFGAALLRQPWVPTQPLTILFSFLLLGCFAATVTTFLVHVLSTDKQPLPYRSYCQQQRPFPHALADSLKPVNVFVGVFSVDVAYERRQLIRSTYLRHTKPIDPNTGRPAQNVQVKFILGRPRETHARRVALEMEMYNDIVVLDLKENMNRGKTHAYFQWASENATVPVYYSKTGNAIGGAKQVGVGFKKADYVVKADDDSLLVLSELERHLRVTPREKTYWGYLIRSLFMGGEVYALSADLVQYVATYEPLLALTNGPEDKRVAKWIRIHPERSMINWVTERCWIYDHPKAGTTYSHGFLFPDEVERIRLEGQQGIEEEERIRRGGDLSQAYSTVTQWKKEYKAPMSGLSMEEEVEALVEGGGRWATWRADAGKGPESVRYDSVVFERDDSRIVEESPLARGVDADEVGVKPGVPDRTVQLPTARLTKFGKDLFRDPADVDAVKVVKRSEGEDFNVVVHNAVPAPASDAVDEDDEKEKAWSSVFATSSSSTTSSSSSASDLPLSSSDSPSATDAPSSQSTTSTSSASESAAPAPSDLPPVDAPVESVPDSDSPSKQIRLPAHNYILPPDTDDLFIPPPTLRYDPETLSVRQRRMLNLPHGGTVAVHFLKRNEWFLEAALALIGREKLWDSGIEAPAVMPGVEVLNQETMEMEVSRMPVWQGVGTVEAVDAVWGGARQYGSPIVREGGYVDLGRKAEARREVVSSVGSTNTRIGNFRGPMLGFRLEEGEEAKIGGGLQVQQPLVVE